MVCTYTKDVAGVQVREEYDRMYGLKMQEMAEVKVYSEVLVPELERMIQ
jgi:hypothetical protein